MARWRKTRVAVNSHFAQFIDALVALYVCLVASGALAQDTAGGGVVNGAKPEKIPQGEIKILSYSDSAIFPGTVRQVHVFIPAQEVWFYKDGRKTQVDSGLKHATGLAYRPDQWLVSVADGGSKWIYSYQINPDGTLANKERFFWLLVPDWEDDAGAESICYAREGQMFVATRLGIQVCADDGPTQVVLPMPDHSRVSGVCLGGQNGNTLFAFCGDRIWKRQVKIHAIGAFTPWQKVTGTKL